MRHVLRFLLALLSCGIAADTFSAPSSIYLRADKACTITEDLSWMSTVYKLDTAFTANDGGTWYGDARVFTQKDLVLSSSVTGYTTAWYTWAKDVSIREEGPKAATKFLSSDASIDLGARLDELPVNPSGIGLAYAKFTPITYSVTYDLAGGTHGASHPSSATYDVPFTVSAPTLTGYAFAGWTWNDETYFAGETAAVTLSNLTVTNGTTVMLTATWKPRQYGLDLVCGEGVAKIFYKVGSATEWSVVTQTTKVSVDNGTAWSAYAEPAYGYSLSGLGSSADDPAKGTISTAGGRFEPKPTKVSFAVKVTADPLESGTVSGSGSYLYESEAELTARPDTGYSFAGWSDGSTENPHKITVLCATNVTARFAAKSYELQLVLSDGVAALFYRLGGAGSYAQTNVTCTVLVPYGTTYEAYATTVPGYILSGSGSSIGSPYRGTMGTTGAVFEPKPAKGAYRVTVTSNPSEAGTTKGDGVFAYGDETTLEATAKTGWYFVNWSDGDENNPHVIIVTSTTNIWANFRKHVYNVTFVYRSSTGVEVQESQSVAYGESALAPTSDKYNCYPGNRFDKWDNNAWGTVTGDLLINAVYVPNTYTVRFNGNGATSGTVNDQTLTYGTEQALALNRYVRTGYLFTGWCTDPTGETGEHYTDEQRVKDIVKASDGTMRAQGATLTLYAQWEPIHYTIRFDANGATSGSMADQVVAYDAAVSLTSNTFSHVQEFRGWTGSDGRSYADGEVVSRLIATNGDKITMKAQWTDTGTILFHRNVDGEDDTYKQPVEKDVEVALLPNAFVRTGYTFDCWTNSAGKSYSDLALVKNLAAPGETTELYAKWMPIKYMVQFDANGGSGKKDPQELTYDVGTTIDSKDFGPPGDGWSFIGWGTNTTEVLIPDKTEIKNISSIDGDHIKLFAIWQLTIGSWSEALGCSNLVFSATAGKWFVEQDETGNTCVSRGKTADEGKLDATMSCPGTLSFSLSPVSSYAEVVIKIGETQIAHYELEGSGNWEKKSLRITSAGAYSIYNKSEYGLYGCRVRDVEWEPDPIKVITSKVEFDLGSCGTRISGGETDQTVAVGEAALEPTVRGVPGWTFTGWDDYGFTNVTKDLTVKAKYERTTYQLVYENTCDKVNPNAKSFVSTDAFEFAPLKDSMGNVAAGFEGWSPSALVAGTTSNLVVKALWKTTEVVTHDVTYVSGTAGGTTNVVEVADGKNAAWPEVEGEEGWTFIGWDKSTDVVTGDVVARARYEVIAYPLVYKNTKGVDHSNPLSYDITCAFNLSSPLNRDTRLKFLGWTPTDRLVKGTTGEQVFTANWAYRITCECGAHVRAGSDPMDLYVTEGGNTNAPNVKVDAGYSLDGWYGSDGKKIDSPFTNITEAVTYTAVAKLNEYTITYENLEGATHQNPSTFTMEDTVTFTAPSAREGHVFTGWVPSGIVRGTTSNVTARATWREAQKYAVEVKAKVGEREASGEATSSSLVRDATSASCEGGDVALYDAERTPVANPGQYVEGANLVAMAAASNGWAFAGWTSGEANSGEAISRSLQKEEGTSSSRSGLETASPLSSASRYAFVVTNDVTLTAVFTQQVFTVTIDGKPTGVRYGETATFSTDASVTNGAVNVVCTGWVGTGDVPASGTSNSVSFVVTQASSLTWQYATNYWVIVDVAAAANGEATSSSLVRDATSASRDGGQGLTALPGTVVLYDAATNLVANPDWYPFGTNLVAEAKAAEGWLFAGWESGEANSGEAISRSLQNKEGSSLFRSGKDSASPLAFAVTSPIALTAVFTQKVFVVSFELDENLKRTGGGALVQSVAYGEAATLPTVEGVGYHALEGWYDAAGRRVDAESLRVITASATYFARSVEAEPYIAADVAAEYEPKETIDPIVIRCVHEEDATLKVTGLPSGLSFTTKEKTYTAKVAGVSVTLKAPANSIYGTPSKSGLWSATVTASVSTKIGGRTVTTTVATTNLAFVIRADGETVVGTEVSLAEDVSDASIRIRDVTSTTDAASPLPGKTTGQGVYAAGKKVTLKATANKGYVFSGWWRGGISGEANSGEAISRSLQQKEVTSSSRSGLETASPLGSASPMTASLLTQSASLALVVPDDDVVYEARFITAADDAASIRASVDGMALFSDEEITLAGTPWPLDVATNVSVGVYLEWPVVADAASAVTVAVSGLPTGLKFTAKPVTQTVTVGGVRTVVTNVPANTIYGTPTAASKTDRYGKVTPSEVKVTVTTAGKAKAIGVVELTVEALPTALVGTYVGGATGGEDVDVASLSGSGKDSASPLGSATVTLAKTGKVSGKWISEGKTWTLSAAGFDAVDDGGRGATALPDDRVFIATATFKCGKETETHPLVFAVNDLGYGMVISDLFSATYVPWKTDAELKELAKELKGEKFTVASDDGVTLTGTVGANGVVSVKGTFDVGAARPYTATASGTLVPVDEEFERFELFVYYPPVKNKFDGYAVRLVLTWDGEELRP